MIMADKKSVNIVIPGDDPVQCAGSPHLEKLKPYGDVKLYADRPGSSAEKVERVRYADIMINSRGVVDWGAAEFEQLPNLKMITTCSIGTDMFDLKAAKDKGIIICNQPGRTAPVVAEHMFGLMFATAKRAAYFTAGLKEGKWLRMNNIMIQGKTLGIVGTGAIGAEMARLGRAIGMSVIAWTFNPTPERAEKLGVTFVELDELLKTADVVSLHLKLTGESTGLIGKRELGLMKKGAILLNGARGAIIDTAALVDALNAGHLTGAGIDVFDEEPVPADYPLLSCEQVILTPHCADMTPEGVDLLNSGAVENIIAYLEGNPRNRVV
jgi:phosphoglycerate dehydrogenase-like enzyme